MTTKAIMTPSPLTLRPDDKVADALSIMHAHCVHNLPVVDDKGCFVGMVGLRLLVKALLPKAAQLDQYSLSDLGYLPDDGGELSERLEDIGQRPVSEFLRKKKKLRFCTPKTPFPELLRLLYKNDTSLPVVVVKGKQQKLVGMVSCWDVLAKVAIKRLPGKTARAETSALDTAKRTLPEDKEGD